MSRIVAWSGHRPDLFRDPMAARMAVDAAARQLVEHGAERFLVGGQRGVDTWAAQSAIARGVPFGLILPIQPEEFTGDWSDEDRQLLETTLTLAAEVTVAAGYTERNRHLATRADLLVAVWTRTAGGGTAETIDFARTAGTIVREIVLEPSAAARSARSRNLAFLVHTLARLGACRSR